MRRIPILFSLAATCLLGPVRTIGKGQASPIPTISNRQFTGGSAKVKVTGSSQIDADVPINTQASISNDGHVWIQYGASGAPTPNLLDHRARRRAWIRRGQGQIHRHRQYHGGRRGPMLGQDRCDAHWCLGTIPVRGSSPTMPRRAMGKVNIEVTFTATS